MKPDAPSTGIKLIIQIPCYNEEKSLPVALAQLPRQLPGVERVEWLVIDDGCSDDTATVARAHGVDHVVSHPHNLGLAQAFRTGLNACLERGADIIVNTDADNQYCADDIPVLIGPILEGRAELVVGARPIDEIESFSPVKKLLQRMGSWVVRVASSTDIPDAPSGFRAISRDAARRINIFNNYTYTLETIIQAGQKNIPITWVPVRTNHEIRPSRLVRSIPAYVTKSMMTIVRIFVVYRPFRFFMLVGGVLVGVGTLIGLRFLYYYLVGRGGGMIQSLILASILFGVGFQTMLTSFVVDLLSVNRRLLEETLYRSRCADVPVCRSPEEKGGETSP